MPVWQRLQRLPEQLLRHSPFQGDIQPGRVPFLQPGSSRPALPFPHPWNFQEPIRILDTYYWGADDAEFSTRHNRYLDLPGFPPVLVTRDPGVIRSILTSTSDRAGDFERDTLPSTGIARATGKDTLLFSNGSFWRRQRRAAASPFGKTVLFQEELFDEFADTVRASVRQRLALLEQHLRASGQTSTRIPAEAEIKPLMLEMLVHRFFGAQIDYQQIRDEYVPAFERVIDHIVRDTVSNRFGVPLSLRVLFSSRLRAIRKDFDRMEELTEIVLAQRKHGTGLWKRFVSDVPDEALRSNLKVFLAGALEATTSYATWAISHLARNRAAQQRLFEEVRDIDNFSPATLTSAKYLGHVLDETLRLTPSLYFLPRRATNRTLVTTHDGRTLTMPSGTHILLDVWHANRHEDHWGVDITGYPALDFVPERWEAIAQQTGSSKEFLHFGFGHGARVCPGKHLGQLEVALIVGVFVKLFDFTAVHPDNTARAGVSTKPADGGLLEIKLRPRPVA